MNHTLAIARRELEEKRFVFTAAIVLVGLVFAIPLFPRIRVSHWREIYVVGSAMIGVPFTLGLAAILGGTVIGREISDRRLSFLFTKPVAAPAIWFGKLIASALLVTGTFLIAMIPGFIAGQKAIRSVWSGEGLKGIAGLAILATVLFFLGHVLSTIARARSTWALVDLAAATILGWIAWMIVQPLVSNFAPLMLLFIAKVFAWMLLVAAIAAGAWQVSRGRTERLQSHLAMSRFLWPAIAVAVAVVGAIVAWTVLATPADLRTDALLGVDVAPAGPYAVVAGNADHRRDYKAGFLINGKTGAWSRVPGNGESSMFSDDGTKLFLVKPIVRGSVTAELDVMDIASGREEPTGLTLRIKSWPVALSPDANRIAYVDEGILTVYDIRAKRSLGSARLATHHVQMWFESSDHLRVLTVTPDYASEEKTRTLSIYDYDVAARALRPTGQFQSTGRRLWVGANADGTKLFVRTGDTGVSVLDAKTGAPVAELRDADRALTFNDGRIVAFAPGVMHLLTPAATPIRDIPFENRSAQPWGVRLVGTDRVIVTFSDRGWHNEIIDINSGAVVQRVDGLQPFFSFPLRRVAMNPDLIARDAHGALLRWNVLTNERTVLVPGKW